MQAAAEVDPVEYVVVVVLLGHAVQRALPVPSANDPIAQTVHSVALIPPSVEDPAGQAVQSADPFLGAMVPASHASQDTDPLALAWDPAGQEVHSVAAAADMVPASH